MKFLFAVVVMFFLLQGCFTVKSNNNFTYQKIEPQNYAAKLAEQPRPYYLIDVRTPGEYAKGHIEGAVNYNFFAFHYGRDITPLDKNIPAFIYCHTCHRSPFAARIMKHKGFKQVYDLKGGFSQWNKQGLPSVKNF